MKNIRNSEFENKIKRRMDAYIMWRWIPHNLLVVCSLIGFLGWLNNIFGPWRQTAHQLTGLRTNDYFDFRQMLNGTLTIFAWRYVYFPFAKVQFREWICFPLPIICVKNGEISFIRFKNTRNR